jgi:23S rRNA pseudouridine2605 synthase
LRATKSGSSRPASGRGGAPAPRKPPTTERIQKVLATAGVASRRKIEELVRAGRVTVNGEPARIGQKIGLRDRVQVDGKGVALGHGHEAVRVLAYKKRTGEIVTRDDPEGRRTVFRKLPKLEIGRWIVIGRLDINTSGLLLFTNSGELARRLMHPSFEIEREYAVRVLGDVDEEMLERLHRGVPLEDGPAHFDKVWRVDGPPAGEDGEGAANRWFHVIVREGRNRVRYGPVELGRGIRSAGYRELEPGEVRGLQRTVGLDTA